MKKRVDDVEIFHKTDFDKHLKRQSQYACACLTCGFHHKDAPDDIVCSQHGQHKRPCKHCTEGYAIIAEIKQKAEEKIAIAIDLLEKQHMDEILYEIQQSKDDLDEF